MEAYRKLILGLLGAGGLVRRSIWGWDLCTGRSEGGLEGGEDWGWRRRTDVEAGEERGEGRREEGCSECWEKWKGDVRMGSTGQMLLMVQR